MSTICENTSSLTYRGACVVVCAGVVLSACGDSEPAAAAKDAQAITWSPLAPGERVDGRTLDEWAVEWGQWSYAQTDCQNVVFDPDASCTLYQDDSSPVLFLAEGPPVSKRENCTLRSGKAVLVPLTTGSLDNALPWKAQRSEDELMTQAGDLLASMRDHILEIDGRSVATLEGYEVGPIRFDYYVPPAPNYYSCNGADGIADTTISPSYLVGHFVMLPAVSAGKHTLRYGGTATYMGSLSASTEVEMTITVND
jgi:hypothetical protein